MKKRKPNIAYLEELGIDEITIDFILRLLIYDPRDRMTVHEALAHPFLASSETSMRSESDLLPYNSGEYRVSDVHPAAANIQAATDPNISEDESIEEVMSMNGSESMQSHNTLWKGFGI